LSVEYLIISESGRALAASAKNAGYEVSVIDRYADRDTVALSRSIHRYEGLHLADFLNDIESYSYLQKLIEYSGKSESNITAIIGSGFEKRPEQIEIIRKYMPVISNSVKTINLAKDPMKLGKLLAKKSINYPFSTINKNDFCSEKEFLIKELGAMGGGHVSVNSNSLLRKTLFDKKYYLRGVEISNSALKPFGRLNKPIVETFDKWQKNEIQNFLKYNKRMSLANNIHSFYDPLAYTSEIMTPIKKKGELVTNLLLNEIQKVAIKNNSDFYVINIYYKKFQRPLSSEKQFVFCKEGKELIYSNKAYDDMIKRVFKNIKYTLNINIEEEFGFKNYDFFDGHPNNNANKFLMEKVANFINS